MKLDRVTRIILGTTALAWSIPFAQAGTPPSEPRVEVSQVLADDCELTRRDQDRDG